MSQDELEYDDEEYEKDDLDGESLDENDFEEEDFDDDDAPYENNGSSYDDDEEFFDDDDEDGDDYYQSRDNNRSSGRKPYRDEIFSKRVPAGKRTYFFDVKTTRSGKDYFLTITESKKVGENRYEKHKLFLYKEDFGKFVSAMHEVVRFIQDECLPDYEFRGLPDVSKQDGELDDDWSDEQDSY